MFRSLLALVVLAACLGCGGDHPEKYLREGAAHFQKQEYDQAIQSYRKAIKLEPKSSVAYNLLGMAYRFKYNQLGNPEMRDQEIAAFKQAIEIDPKNWGAMINLGATYYFQGDKAKAAPLFQQALTLNPHHPEKPQIEQMIAAGAGQE